MNSTPKHRLALAVLVVWLMVPHATVGAAGPESDGLLSRTGPHSSESHAQGHILIKVSSQSGFRPQDASSLKNGWYRVPVGADQTPDSAVAEFATQPGIVAAEVDLVFHKLVSPPFIPDDPLYTSGEGNPSAQWHLHATDLPRAWTSTVGAGVKIGVIDSGVSPGPDGFCHPLVDEYDVILGVTGPGSAFDLDGHGTHVAGVVAQCSGNSFRGAGVAPEARVIPIVVLHNSQALSSHIAQGIDWARTHGARVINLSLGTDQGPSQIVDEAIARAVAADIVIVAASGNVNGPLYYPASHPSTIAVGATGLNGLIAPYSARGSGLDLVAPGGTVGARIWQETSAVLGGGVVGEVGTSFAAPHVSGIAALLRSKYPQATSGQVRLALQCSAKLADEGFNTTYGHGLVQAGAALRSLASILDSGSSTCVPMLRVTPTVSAVETASGFWRQYESVSLVRTFFYGNPGDFPFMGDWNCNGVATPGLYRQSDGYVYLRNSNTQGIADISFFFGIPGDVPIAGDFNGDGCDTVSIYRPSEARFYIINKLGSADGGLGAADFSFLFGNVGDVPFVGDWNSNGIDTPGLRRPTDGFVYLRHTNTQGIADTSFFYGNPGDVVFAGDWNSNGRDSIGLYRPSNGTIYLRYNLSTGVADMTFNIGPGVHPAAGHAQ